MNGRHWRWGYQADVLFGEFHPYQVTRSLRSIASPPPTPQPLSSILPDSILIVHGDRDRIFPVSMALEMYEAIPDSYLWVVPNGPHGVNLRTQRGHDSFLEVALDFLDGKWGSR